MTTIIIRIMRKHAGLCHVFWITMLLGKSVHADWFPQDNFGLKRLLSTFAHSQTQRPFYLQKNRVTCSSKSERDIDTRPNRTTARLCSHISLFGVVHSIQADKVSTEQQHETSAAHPGRNFSRSSLLSGLQYTNRQLQKMRHHLVLTPLLICLDSPWRLH